MSGLAAVELRHYQSGDEEQIVEILSCCHSHRWGNEALWNWKHLHRPGFTPEDVTVACMSGKMVGCFHEAILPFKVEPGLEVLINLEGDFGILPECRKLGIPDQAHDLCSPRLLARGVMLRGGFTSSELNDRFYHKRFGYVFVPSTNLAFRKTLNSKLLFAKLERYAGMALDAFKMRQVFRHLKLVTTLQVEDFPPCQIEATDALIRITEGISQTPHLTIQITYADLVAMQRGPGPFIKSAVTNFVLGRFRIRGLLRTSLRVLQSLSFHAAK
jgi:hypothetical protein